MIRSALQDDLYSLMPVLSILELLAVLAFLGHFCGCFFYYFSMPRWQVSLHQCSYILRV